MLWDLRNKERNEAAAAAAAVSDAGQLIPTKVLRKFLASLTSRESPVLMDLGPVVGSNVTELPGSLSAHHEYLKFKSWPTEA